MIFNFNFKQIKERVKTIRKGFYNGTIGKYKVESEMSKLWLEINQAMMSGQTFKYIYVKTPEHDQLVECYWLEVDEPRRNEKVEVFMVEDILNVAYRK